ncbi:MAG: alpha/beta fold hydrolase [Sphingomonas sp.]
MRWLKRIGYGAAALALVAAIALIVFRTPDTDPAAMRAKYGGPPSQFVELGGGLTVHLRDTGPRDAPVLMLLHGSNDSLHAWEDWAERLDKRYRVIRYDQIGHGLTGPNPTGDYTIAAFVDMVERVRTKLGVDHIVLAGNSMGGGVALHYAVQHPEHVAGLILVDSAGARLPADRVPALVFRIAATPVLGNLATIITPRSVVEGGLSSAFSDQALVTDALIDRGWELLRYPGNRAATIARFATPDVPLTAAQFAALRLPVLIQWGANDQAIPLQSGKWLNAHIPGSTLAVYPGTGHVPMEEAADASAADAYRFIEARVMPGLKP